MKGEVVVVNTVDQCVVVVRSMLDGHAGHISMPKVATDTPLEQYECSFPMMHVENTENYNPNIEKEVKISIEKKKWRDIESGVVITRRVPVGVKKWSLTPLMIPFGNKFVEGLGDGIVYHGATKSLWTFNLQEKTVMIGFEVENMRKDILENVLEKMGDNVRIVNVKFLM